MSLRVDAFQEFVAPLAHSSDPVKAANFEKDVALITKIALEHLPNTPPSTAEKSRLYYLIQDNFPFCQVSEAIGNEALMIPAGECYITTSAVLNALLKARIQSGDLVPGSATWQEMQTILEALDYRALADLFSSNHRQCERDQNLLSGYCFHLLLKMFIKEDHPLPEMVNCTLESVESASRDCISNIDYSEVSNAPRLMELILFRDSRSDSPLFLKYAASDFWPFLMHHLKNTPFEIWPNKGILILELFEIPHNVSEDCLILTLCHSACDSRTEEIGWALHEAFAAQNPCDAYPHFHRLYKLLPHMNEEHIDRIFGLSFPPFERNSSLVRSLYQDPPEVHRLNFDGKRNVRIYKNLILGIHRNLKEKLLLAYNKENSHLIWSLPIEIDSYLVYQEIHPLGLVIAYDDDPNIYLYNPENGDQIATIPLPAPPQQMYLTPSGFCYFEGGSRNHCMLYGGQITSNKWIPSFEIPPLPGRFFPLGNYLTFKDLEKTPFIVNQTGSLHSLKGTTALLYKNLQLFTAKKGAISLQPFLILFCIDVPGKELPFDTEGVDLLDVCEDGTLICCKKESYYFIDVIKEQVIKIPHTFPYRYGSVYIDTKKGAVWSWDTDSATLWKHTKEGSQNRGTLKGNAAGSIVHIDEEEKVYFQDFPF